MEITRTLHRIRAKAKGAVGMTWRERCRRLPIEPSKVMFESYAGNGLTGSPEAIFRYLARCPSTSALNYVWVVRDEAEFANQIRYLKSYAPFATVKRGSREYYRHLYTSKYLVNNMSFGPDFVKREGQIYLNTWHGTPLKKMGYDVAGRIEEGKNIVRNFLQADYALSASRAVTERMYLGAFRLSNLFEGTILEEGYPRTDLQHDRESARHEIAARYPHLRLEEDKRKIILYAPTWRGANYESPENPTELIRTAVEEIEASVDNDQYRVLFKVHQVVAQSLRAADLTSRMVPGGANANTVLGVADVLVTDYSSIFFDFLATGRPIIHYAPDIRKYAQYRDVYDAIETWPGEVAGSHSELRGALEKATSPEWRPSSGYQQWANKWAPHDDGGVTERVVKVVFLGEEPNLAVVKPSDGRKKIIFYVGALMRNGITSAALNLLSNIDHTRYDVTALVPFNRADKERLERANAIHPDVRVLFRHGRFTGSALANWNRTWRQTFDKLALGADAGRRHRHWNQEWKRIVGDAQFDYLVDFTGYSPFWGSLFIAANSGKRLIWQHNDLWHDARRTVNGKRPLYVGLKKVFSLYPHFDSIVSVSQPLREINRRNLADSRTARKYDWVPNTLNIDQLSVVAMEPSADDQDASECFTFINVGRLSPEKNHQRLISAFDIVQQRHPEVRLLLLGDGPYRDYIAEDIVRRGLSDKVEMRGTVPDPYPVMQSADCLVVSSDYEGQPMVILEAMALGLPVISTRFDSVAGVFPNLLTAVVEPSAEALAEAMSMAVVAPPKRPSFSAEEYNRQSIRQLESILRRIAS